MIDEIKRIKLEELNNQIAPYNKKEITIMKRLYAMRYELDRLEREQSDGITIRNDFSFLEKWITRRGDYKKFKEQSKRLSKIDKLKSEIDEEKVRVEHELEASGIKAKIDEIILKKYSIEKARTLYEMGITPIDAIKLLESKGIQPVLSESDKCIFEHPRNYSSKSSLIGVHKTRHAPTANIIKSAKDANADLKTSVTINGVKYEYFYRSGRNTVHMAMNDEVSSHSMGSWDDCEYAVLIPFDDIPNEKIGRAAPMDTFTRGSIELSENAWILCPKNEVDKLKIFNPKVHVLGYEGESVKGFAKSFLTQLGYRTEDTEMWTWRDEKSAIQFRELMAKEGLKIDAHSYTYFHDDEQSLTGINQAVSLSKLLRDNHLITNSEDIENIMNQLEGNCQSYRKLLASLGSSIGGSDIESDSIVGNGKHIDIFLEEMRKNGFYISPVYQELMKKLCKVSIYKCNEDSKNTIFNIPEGTSKEEQKAIEELQTVLISDNCGNTDEKFSAFGNFLSIAICDSILHSKGRESSIERPQQEGR